ncbi:MAG: polyphosphate kinase 1 [Enterococcus sp.]
MLNKEEKGTNPYFNRELTWLDFNQRVLLEAINDNNPLLEKLNFLAIASSNLDEFFRIRVGGLHTRVRMNYLVEDSKTGLDPIELLSEISQKNHQQVAFQYQTFHQLEKELNEQQIQFQTVRNLTPELKERVAQIFKRDLFPVLSPFGIDAYRPFPHLKDGRINIYVSLQHNGIEHIAILPIPSLVDRFFILEEAGQKIVVLTEDIITHHIAEVFSGYEINAALLFRLIRDNDLSIQEDDVDDLLEIMEDYVIERKKGGASRIEVTGDINPELLDLHTNILMNELELTNEDCYVIDGPLDLTFLRKLTGRLKNHLPNLVYPSFKGYSDPDLVGEALYHKIDQEDLFFHHPYDSFSPIVAFLEEAANDPDTIAIKQTLYRVSGNSPIVAALKKAAEAGKQVTVLVELKARFDEANNVFWAKELEAAGCYVFYGVSNLKTHSKVALVVKKKKQKIQRYVHLATGNYNEITSNFYTDMGILTSKTEVVEDVTNFFNYISGYSEEPQFNHIVISPNNIRENLIVQIDKEIDLHNQHQNGHIILKANALTDRILIEKLFEASNAGVKIDLIVRGACCLRPGLAGFSENVRVISIVGRFLEHSRIYYFHHNGKETLYLSSADLMTRNMDDRIEISFPILKSETKQEIVQGLHYWLDDQGAYQLDVNGVYRRIAAISAEESAQHKFMDHARAKKEQHLVIERKKSPFFRRIQDRLKVFHSNSTPPKG